MYVLSSCCTHRFASPSPLLCIVIAITGMHKFTLNPSSQFLVRFIAHSAINILLRVAKFLSQGFETKKRANPIVLEYDRHSCGRGRRPPRATKKIGSMALVAVLQIGWCTRTTTLPLMLVGKVVFTFYSCHLTRGITTDNRMTLMLNCIPLPYASLPGIALTTGAA